MAKIELQGQRITDVFTAGASISDQDAVALTGADTVSPASDTEVQNTIGVANEAAASGEDVEVVLIGKKDVVADGAVGVGEPLVPATTAGRVVSELNTPASHSHNVPSDASGTTINAEFDGSGNLAAGAGGSIEGGDAAPENARTFAMSLGTTAGAGETVTVLVGVKTG